MIIEALMNVVFGIVNTILSPISLLGWSFDLALCSPLGDILKVVYYVLPIGKLSPIITFIVSMFIFRAVIALIKTIWDLIPIL